MSWLPVGLGSWLERRRAFRELRVMQSIDEDVLSLDDNNPLQRAKVASEAGDMRAALAYWQEARLRYPGFVRKSPDTLELLLRLRRFDEADALMLECQAEFPKVARYHEGYARVASDRGDLAAAVPRWEIVRKRFPQRWMGYANGADVLMRLDRVPEAKALMEHAMQLFPDQITCHFTNARIAEREGNWTEASHRWDATYERFKHPLGAIRAAHALQELGRGAEAEERLKAARMRHPTEEGVAYAMAQLAEARRETEKAVEAWAFVRLRFPLSSLGYRDGAKLLRELGRLDEADAVLAAAVERFPQDSWPRCEHAFLAHTRRDWEEAAKRWEAARAAFPNEADTYLRGAEALSALGKEDDAARLRAEHAKLLNVA